MIVEQHIPAVLSKVRTWQADGHTVGFVPTMGALHSGHASLIATARDRCDRVVVSIFVNPIQFGPNEDLASYPRTEKEDQSLCRSLGVDLIFSPSVEDMYGDNTRTSVHVSGLTERLCGAHRKGHFDGVTTVVAKLFSIVPGDFAFFGEKDYQQLVVIRQMVEDLNLAPRIVGCPTVREADGLAMSSRNAYLDADQRSQATVLHRSLQMALRCITEGQRDCSALIDLIRNEIDAAGPAALDYIEIVDAQDLSPLTVVDRSARICLAVRIGDCRLIDNVGVDVGPGGG